MDKQFWLTKWDNHQIGFHEGTVNAMLKKHFRHLTDAKTIFVPLCGKAQDMVWFIQQGIHVVGVEYSDMAIQQLFDSLHIEPAITKIKHFNHYKGPSIDIFVGDLFDLTPKLLPKIEAVYDRASLVALPKHTRLKYSKHLHQITNGAKQLLISFEYPKNTLIAPPFSVPSSEIQHLYGSNYRIQHLDATTIPLDKLSIDQHVYALS